MTASALVGTDRKPPLKVLLCSPRGFCAGVVRAIDTVERALARYGAPVYVRHEIVHNRYVVESLKAKGAVFVEELDEIPDTDAPVIFSAHGVPKSIPAEAQRRNFFALDATCPLVTKVHREAEIHHKRGREIVLIGHADHPEVVGTVGQLPAGAITLVQSVAEVARFAPRDPSRLAYVTQTTLSVDDTADIVAALKQRFPDIHGPHKEDICYATTNRQEVVKKVAPMVEAMIVVGSPNSSNTQRLGDRLVGVRLDREPRRHRRSVRAGGAGRGGDRRLRRALHGRGTDRHHRGRGHVLPAAAGAARHRSRGMNPGGG
jgi:4-hydroxy-3-methylbut-2-en-1-yl diphosphate reductase